MAFSSFIFENKNDSSTIALNWDSYNEYSILVIIEWKLLPFHWTNSSCFVVLIIIIYLFLVNQFGQPKKSYTYNGHY